MNDDFLYDFRREPSPEFSRRLKARLWADDPQPRSFSLPRRAAKWTALAASFALVALAFTFPAVRAGAQAFLDLFRVVNFAGVSFDPDQVARLDGSGLDLPRLIGDEIEVLKEPAAPMSFASLDDASAAAGIRVRAPAWLPVGWELTSTTVGGEAELRVTTNTDRLQQLLDALALDDVAIPDGLDGQSVTVRVPPVVHLAYSNDTRTASLTQSRSPDVSLPAGLDFTALAEIGLRILGLSRTDAFRFAQSIDWRTTLIVPVPVNVASFRQVDVQGQNGLLIEAVDSPSERGPRESLVLWSSDGQVYALRGALRTQDLMEMAQTVQ